MTGLFLAFNQPTKRTISITWQKLLSDTNLMIFKCGIRQSYLNIFTYALMLTAESTDAANNAAIEIIRYFN
jgi:hypothetical protein